MGTSVEIRGISKSFVRNTKVLNPLDLTIASGELFFLLGSSGCGKSTLLRIIAGLLKPDTGSVLFNGNDITDIPFVRLRKDLMHFFRTDSSCAAVDESQIGQPVVMTGDESFALNVPAHD